jgi:uncharacterized protein (TIGR02996 family)
MAKKKVSGHDRAFLDDVAAHPEEDGPRLVYADWLEDNGQPHRADLIRVQCRLARMDECDPERLPLEQREADLLCVHEKEWASGLPAWALENRHAFRRGFPDRISITATDLLKRGESLFAAAPITDLQIRNLLERMPQVAAYQLLARLTALDFYQHTPSTPDLRALGASPHLGALRALRLPALSFEQAQALASWPALPRLSRLELGPREAGALETLAGSGRLASLRRLQLVQLDVAHAPSSLPALAAAAPGLTYLEVSNHALTPDLLAVLADLPALTSLRATGRDGADALADAAVTERLTSLDLSWPPLSSQGVARLAGRQLTRLRRLSLIGTSLRYEGAARLAVAPLDALARLDLYSAGINAQAVRQLAASPRLAGLRWLCLNSNPLEDEGAVALAGSPHLTGLLSLDLRFCRIGPPGAAALAASPNLARLRFLDLTRNPLGPEGVLALAGSPHLGELRVLVLAGINAGEEGARALARSRTLTNLRRLDLSGCALAANAAVAREFADPSHLPNLLSLSLDHSRTDSSGLTAIGRAASL